MALFNLGHGRAAAEPSPGARAAAGPNPGEQLAGRLREISGGPIPEDMLEPALQAILEAAHVSAGAICLYDPRRELLRLAVEVGLSDDGCQALRSVRRCSGSQTWDIPLSSLLNRRAYLIESAAKNRYVPPLVDDGTPQRTIACLPLLGGNAALGSLVLIARGAETLNERTIRNLEAGVRELARIIEAVRRRAAGAAEATPPPAPTPAPAARATRTEIPAPAAMPGPPDAAVDEMHLSRDAALACAEAARRQVTDLERTLAEVQSQAARQEAELQTVRKQLSEARIALAREEQVRNEMSVAATSPSDDAATLRDDLREAREALEAARQRAAEVEGTLAEMRADRDRLHREATTLRASVAEYGAALHHERQRAEGLAAELARGTEDSREAVQTAVAAAEAAQAAAAAQAEAVAGEQRRLHEELAGLRRANAESRERIVELERGLASARVEGEALAATQQRVAALGDDLSVAREAAAVAEAARAAAVADAEAHAAGRALLEEELDTLRARLEAANARIADLERRVPPARERPQPAPPPAPTPVGAGPAAEPEPLIVVLDGDTAWEAEPPANHRVSVVAPDAAAATLAAMNPARVIANLAAPGMLDTLSDLRAAGSAARVWGCVAAGGRALALGMIEPAARPIDVDAVLPVLAGYAWRGARLFTAGTDADALISLRQALARQGMSVSIAWDGKQAADLLNMIRPDVAIVDLTLPPRKGYGIITRLATLDPPPTMVLLPGGDDAAGFAAALAESKTSERAVPLAELLASVLRRSATPSERR